MNPSGEQVLLKARFWGVEDGLTFVVQAVWA